MIDQKYRPHDLKDIIGQDNAILKIERLLRLITDNGCQPLAVLLTGPSGCGKTTTAEALARELNSDPWHGTYRIDSRDCDLAAVKELESNAQLCAPGTGWKTYIIDECHEITKGAQGRLLNTLEALPNRRCIVATSTQPEPFPNAALTSRFLHIKLERPDAAAAAARIEEIARHEAVTPPPRLAILDILRRHSGNLRAAINEIVMMGTAV